MQQDSRTTLVIVDSGEFAVDGAALAGVGPATVLSFTQSQATVDQVVSALAGEVRVESGAPAVDDVGPGVSERYVALLGRLPQATGIDSEPTSLWWLHELSGRRSDIYPTFTRLCQLEVVRRAIVSSGATDVVLVSGDGAFSAVIGSLCEVVGVRYQAPAVGKANPGMSYGGIFTRLALWSARAVAQTALAKLLTLNTKPARAAGAPVCAFHTLYPSFFITTHGVMDEKFHGVPNLIEAQGVTPFLAVTFAADDGHQHMTMGAYLRACLRLRRTPRFNDVPARLVDRDLGWRALLAGLVSGAVAALKNVSLERSRPFREACRLDDVDIFPLLRPEMRMAAYRTPRYLMHMRRLQASIDVIRPDAVAGSLFEFCYGRATSMAIARSRTKPLNIGVQHGPTGRKLMYRFAPGELTGVPMPDHLLLESEEALAALGASGFPAERAHVEGAPRVDSLTSAPRWRAKEGDSTGSTRVLVAFGGSDGAQIMGICKPVIERATGYHFIMKPHPRSSIQPPQIEAFLSQAQGSTYDIATGSIYELLETADVVVATYSSVGMEAAALGYPVVTLNLPDFASPSGMMDLAGEVRFAASPDDLETALAAAAGGEGGVDVEKMERTFFSRLDGQAQQRWAETIARLTKERAS
jgi:surface carbohydrate biosynthesis protein (TIGR04326 family)